MENEIGREMLAQDLAHELVIRTVVVLCKEGRPSITAWVEFVDEHFAAFQMNPPDRPTMHLLLFRQPDGTLTDDSGARIRVYEYLGEV